MAKKNPYRVGDIVRLGHDLKDAYGEVYNGEGEEEEVISIADDGEGLMFRSNLGIHFTEVEPVRVYADKIKELQSVFLKPRPGT